LRNPASARRNYPRKTSLSSLTDDVEKEAEAKDQEKRRETENEEKKGGERKREVIRRRQ